MADILKAQPGRETSEERDLRLRTLWHDLDISRKGELDFQGLKKAMATIDHHDMLRQIIETVDTNGDGKIQFEEFRNFVYQAEQQLATLFRSIDHDHDGRLNPEELYRAFKAVGLSIPQRRLTRLFRDMDSNEDGFVTFDEWRDFLLFIPSLQEEKTPLHAVLSFYSAIVTLNAEGDSLVSDDTLEGLGRTETLFQTLFGSILRLASAPSAPAPTPVSTSQSDFNAQSSLHASSASHPQPTSAKSDGVAPSSLLENASISDTTPVVAGEATVDQFSGRNQSQEAHALLHEPDKTHKRHGAHVEKKKKLLLTDLTPDPGYFVAGAIAGGVSRTATAPLDRLKVYLLVNTQHTHNHRSSTTASSVVSESVTSALKRGKPWTAIRLAAMPLSAAVRDIWSQGGIRNFFTGNGLNVVKIMPETAIKFGTYEAAKRTLASFEGHDDPNRLTGVSKFAAGGVAGMVAQVCVYPLDTLKFRLQCEVSKGGLTGHALVLETAKNMYRTGGVRAAYRGVVTGLVGMFPYSAIDMGTFEFLKKSYCRYTARQIRRARLAEAGAQTRYEADDLDVDVIVKNVKPGNVMTGMIGATSGAFGATMVYPLNVLRTRLQTQGTKAHPATYTGIWDVAAQTLRHEGVRGLYKGLTPNLLKVAPALSITWVVYENSKRLLKLD